jgi:long-chain fatty acid transport protein
MKKIAVLISGAFLLMNTAFAGGILTNINQSAQFVRMLSRNASTDLDAVYYNPAGLTQLKNGFYFGLQNQTILQTKTINSEFPYLNNHNYTGKVNVPVFPTAFAVYKLDNWAFSAGFGPNAGGGSAEFKNGIPSFEKQISTLVPALGGLSALGFPVEAYDVDIEFKGTSVFWGIQLGATYKINENISVYGGARYVPAVNTYTGSITNIKVGPKDNLQNAQTYLTNAAAFASGKAQATAIGANNLQQIIDGGGGDFTTAQLVAAKKISPETKAQIDGGLQQLGLTAEQIAAISISSAHTNFATASAQLTGTANKLNAIIPGLGEKQVDTKQTGAGVTPIVGIDIHLDKLNIGLKYEYTTFLGLTNDTKVDGTGFFTDGEKSNSDIPMIIAGGAEYKILDNLKISGSFDLYMDKKVAWGGNVYKQARTIDKNFLELGFGLEYELNKNFALSAGYLNSNSGVSEAYQSDFSFSNDSYTTGLGFQWKMNKKLVLDAGMTLTTYKDYIKTFDGSFDPLAVTFGSYKETYGKDTFSFAIGIGYKIF